MYGTVARTRVKPENRAKLSEVFEQQGARAHRAGDGAAYTLFENEADVAWLFAIFEDRVPTTRTPTIPHRTRTTWSTGR